MKIQFSLFCGLLVSLFVAVGAKAQTVNDVKTLQSTPTVDQILDRYAQAIGGVTAYRKLTSSVTKMTLVIGDGKGSASIESYRQVPNKAVQIGQIKLANGSEYEFSNGFDGAVGWVFDPTEGGVRELSGAKLAEEKRDSEFYWDIKLKELYPKMALAGQVSVDNRLTHCIEATPPEGAPIKLYFDAQTGLLVRYDSINETATGGKVPIETYFEDYREVDGVKMPFTIRQPRNECTYKISEVRHNVPIEEAKFKSPIAIYTELSQPVMKAKTEKGAKVKMRDGVELVADIIRPADEGKYPAILIRTPYGRQRMAKFEGEWWARRGYVYIAQDVRGRNDSDGEWNPFFNERKDGYDTIDWIIKQPWSDGKVGMIGGSYDGWVQWAAAAEAHPGLKCIVPEVSPPDLFFNVTYDHGVPHLYGHIMWVNFVRAKRSLPMLKPITIEKFKSLTLSRIDDEVFGQSLPFFDRSLEMETHSAFAGANFMPDMKKIKIPILHISGWWDGDGIGAKLNWAAMRTLGHRDQWLIYGPWGHQFNTTSRVRGVDYGPKAVIEMNSIYLRWFDQWLKGKPVKWSEQPKARIFVTGANEWRALEDWPDPRSKEMSLYLSSQGPANSSASVGELRREPPKEEKPDRYTYNPASVETPKEDEEPRDIMLSDSTLVRIESSDKDLLVYKTAPMTESLEIGGPIELDLYFSTSARDTDFFAYLVDIDEQDVMHAIGLPGKIRAKYLSGWDQPTLLVPDKVYRATIALWDTAHQFKKGHRLGVVIQSQMFPSYARNLNTGEPSKNATRMVAASQTIYHDAKRPSRLRFYLLPAAEK